MSETNAEPGQSASKPGVKSFAKRAPAKKKVNWLDELLESSMTVARTAKKLDFYRDARRDPPEHLWQLLDGQEQDLNKRVKSLLQARANLKDDIFEDERFQDDAIDEIEFSYQKAVCFAEGKQRAHSRMFFLPCVYWSQEGGATDGLVDFSGDKGSTFADFVSAFLDEHFGDAEIPAAAVSVYGASLSDWSVQSEEEKMLPALHEAILAGTALDIDAAFPARAGSLAKGNGEGWAVAVLPFAVEHDDEAWLESISFEGYEDDFLEGFEEIFDSGSKLDYAHPCDPTIMQDEAVRHLWHKQVDLTFRKMSSMKKSKQMAVIEATFAWDEGEFVGVMMDCKIIDPKASQEDEQVLWRCQIGRPTLIGETPGQLSAFLVEHPLLLREDFDVVFGHQLGSA